MIHEEYSLGDMPAPARLKRVSQGLALLDAILMPAWDRRFFSYDASWDVDAGQQLASMRNGSGAGYFIVFVSDEAVGKVFDSNTSAPNLGPISGIPDQYSWILEEPAFGDVEECFYFWRDSAGTEWRVFPNADRGLPLLQILIGGFDRYVRWASDYYEVTIDSDVANAVYSSLTVNEHQLSLLNAEATLEAVLEDVAEITGSH